MSIIQTLHAKAERLREDDQLVPALALLPEILTGYHKEHDYQGFCEALQGAFLCYKHLFLLSNDISYALIGHHHALASYDIASRHSLPMTQCHFVLGESYMLQNDFNSASLHYTSAIDSYPKGPLLGNLRRHLGEATVHMGDLKAGKNSMLQGLKEIQDLAGTYDEFVCHVWESGCYMRLYDLFYTNEAPETLRAWAQAAKHIIETDPKLVIRKRQLATLLEQKPLP